ncbi:hypothetical protein IFT73_13530 [Aeromicrobium sp. CFBP 8757]|uniref:Ig-like domain-containing protein n=1 Tax=Aeromicrobium sp. CFBP 8757 TaxID=2775288 RepID=UPI00177BBD02|nr:hypothetical protein [Aeromicrobium sp. CFBP 8757]MBD8607878.1 hypothetical protein [Aeromicrobium sp. CFBP 8757]
MKTVTFTRALGLGVTAVLVSSAFQFTPASAAPATTLTLTVDSQDGAAFQPSDYAADDIAVQVEDSAGAYDVDDAQDLRYTWEYTPFGTGAKSVTLPATGFDEQTTDVKGRFTVALPVSQGAGTYALDAVLEDEPAGTTGAPSVTRTFTVGNAAPAGSTATVTGLGGSTPGLAQGGTLTVEDANGKPVAGQVFSLTVDHGFFTPGAAPTPAAGSRVGDLESAGTKLTGLTDQDGQIDFDLGIARDAGFDDDAKVAAAVTVAGVTTSGTNAAWSTDNPLNGGVAIRLSPAGEQDGPVNPALAGNRTFYDVFALDQFGNPVAKNAGTDISIGLGYTRNVDDYDYSDDEMVADLDTFGDIWLTSFEAGTIDVNGLWEEAPTTVYGTGGTPVKGVKDVTTSTASTTYEISFGASRFSISSSAADTVRVGSTVTQTVRVVDQQGNPVNGWDVRFLRYGPDAVRGDVVATRTTNAAGEATYSFIGTARGRATITAEVTDGVRRRELTGTAAFGATVRARLARTKGTTAGRGADRLTVAAGRVAAGARVDLYRVVKGVEKRVGSRTLGRKGTASFVVRDTNRSSRTTYVAQVRSTTKTVADRSNGYKTR